MTPQQPSLSVPSAPVPLRIPAMHRGLALLAAALLSFLAAWSGSDARAGTTTLATPPRLATPATLAATPPMGWNDWAHYQCDYTAATILANARALVKTGLAARGYGTVTIDDCWMLKTRDSQGNLQPDPRLFPQGMKPVADAIHALGLKFGIYEDAGSETCGRFAGSGEPQGGGQAHFLADAKLFASWGVDYLKLDGCNVYVPKGGSANDAYRAAYRAESTALAQVGRPITFSESAPAYFQGQPAWYDVLSWVRGYGQLWREGTDMANYHGKTATHDRFASVLWNYSYNLPLGRFQTPGNWDDPDFIIGGDTGMTLAESRSQLALWAMMSAPLILSSDIDQLSPAAVRILGNRAVLSVDQDPLGRMATLLSRSVSSDVLIKPLHAGGYAVAELNRSTRELPARLTAADLGFGAGACRFDALDLWTGRRQTGVAALRAHIAAHDTAIWTIRPGAACGTRARIGTITRVLPGPNDDETHPPASRYTRCLAAPGKVAHCTGTAADSWEVMSNGALRSGDKCLAQKGGRAVIAACDSSADQTWQQDLPGRIINSASHQCLTGSTGGALSVAACGNNPPTQIWALP
ncbi:MAG TPA: ricin-type beta-trefoil lectin domain protein [Steroidobacteraceae bacterium]|nr:ricin-type beta-trefoil lectin domain protein [Steroidobacteraceae bacterium]